MTTTDSRTLWQTKMADFAPFYAYWWRDGQELPSEELKQDDDGWYRVRMPEAPGSYLLKVYGYGNTLHYRTEIMFRLPY